MLDTLTAESFEPHIGTAFVIRTDGHVETLTLTAVERSKHKSTQFREGYSLLFDGSSKDVMFHSQIVNLEHEVMGELPIMISAFGRNDDGTFRYEAVFN